ncbi:hypothetical protein I3760_01G104800 [Carya illinoinensis]|nr:hypothetical protein I3760_01G104800 [Carya illinoinensis]
MLCIRNKDLYYFSTMSWDTLSSRIEAIKKKVDDLTPIATKHCIYKVHEQLLDVNKEAYKPVLLAIGPYNHQEKVRLGSMEQHKLRYLQQIMLRETTEILERCIKDLRELEEKARKCYVECISQNPDEFVEMMLIDGCFVIELFRKHEIYRKTKNCSDHDPIFQMQWVLPKIARDLLLFENQLPFFILEKLFENMSKSNRSRNLGEYTVEILDKDEISVESSSSTNQIFRTQLNDLALGFFSAFLPFQWDVNAPSYNSTDRIGDLLCLVLEAPNPILTELVCQRLLVGFRFKNAEFDHLLGLIHASISISILDTAIKNQEVGLFKHLFGLIRKAVIRLLAKKENMREENSYASGDKSPFSLELQNVGVKPGMAKKFMDHVSESNLDRWIRIPYALELQEAGIEFNKDLQNLNRNKDQKSEPCETRTQKDGVESKTAEEFKRLLCLNKIQNYWKSIRIEVWNKLGIPFAKELLEARVGFHKAKKFKRLHALREIERRNIYSAKELEEAGIKFKKAEKRDVFSIKFNKGLMEISPLSIEDETETYIRNLMAYEQYCERHKGYNYVTNYVCFMDDLINTPKDVELLRRSRIIRNYLGDDGVTSTMVNNLGRDINIISSRSSIYARTSMYVNMHCRRSWNVWLAKLRHDYFNSPWAIFSLLAAVLLLALAITQTIFSIIP